MKITTTDLIHFLPIEASLKEKLLSGYDSLSKDQKLAVSQICWKMYYNIYNARVQLEIKSSLAGAVQKPETLSKQLINETEQRIHHEFTELISKKQEEKTIGVVRKDLESLIAKEIDKDSASTDANISEESSDNVVHAPLLTTKPTNQASDAQSTPSILNESTSPGEQEALPEADLRVSQPKPQEDKKTMAREVPPSPPSESPRPDPEPAKHASRESEVSQEPSHTDTSNMPSGAPPHLQARAEAEAQQATQTDLTTAIHALQDAGDEAAASRLEQATQDPSFDTSWLFENGRVRNPQIIKTLMQSETIGKQIEQAVAKNSPSSQPAEPDSGGNKTTFSLLNPFRKNN